jgi:hypothetical protein
VQERSQKIIRTNRVGKFIGIKNNLSGLKKKLEEGPLLAHQNNNKRFLPADWNNHPVRTQKKSRRKHIIRKGIDQNPLRAGACCVIVFPGNG